MGSVIKIMEVYCLGPHCKELPSPYVCFIKSRKMPCTWLKPHTFSVDPVSLANAGLVKTQTNKENKEDALTVLSLWLNPFQNTFHKLF